MREIQAATKPVKLCVELEQSVTTTRSASNSYNNTPSSSYSNGNNAHSLGQLDEGRVACQMSVIPSRYMLSALLQDYLSLHYIGLILSPTVSLPPISGGGTGAAESASSALAPIGGKGEGFDRVDQRVGQLMTSLTQDTVNRCVMHILSALQFVYLILYLCIYRNKEHIHAADAHLAACYSEWVRLLSESKAAAPTPTTAAPTTEGDMTEVNTGGKSGLHSVNGLTKTGGICLLCICA